MGHQGGTTSLRNTPRAPFLAAISSCTDPELVIDIGINMEHYEFCVRADIHIFKVAGRNLTILEPVILWHKVLIDLKQSPVIGLTHCL